MCTESSTVDLKFVAMNIVNQILDEAGTDVDIRQAINDDCTQFVKEYLELLSL